MYLKYSVIKGLECIKVSKQVSLLASSVNKIEEINMFAVIIPPTNFVVVILFSRQCVQESLLDFHQTLQTCSYMQDKYFRQKNKG